jgi:3-deoxy-7-phosphoheptulonate synthase
MIIPKKEKLSAEELKQVEKIAEDSECSILEIQGRNRCVYAILGDESKEVMFKRIAGLPFIRKVDRIESPYKLMDRRSALADHRVKVGATEVGKDAPFVIGGPCTIDPANPNLFIETAHALKEAGVNALRGGSLETAYKSLFFSGG